MSITAKINRILALFLVAFLAIILKVWHLGIIQREEKLLEAQKPRARTLLARADRGIICDRFGIPMALNRICYNAAIYYSQIAQIPSITWRTDEGGKQMKVFARKEYIRNLAASLAKTLDLDAERLEDLIHSKAALFPHVPFVIKSGLQEDEYYRLRMMEKDWPGLHAEISSTRFYPLGKTGCHILGTMGAISQREYTAIAQEMSELQIAEEFDEPFETHRLTELKEKAYAMTDLIGKTGIEAQCEEVLRGFFGKKTFEIDQKGCFVRELSEKKAIAGKKIVLSISSELQQFAESLLTQDEKVREGRSIGVDPADKTRKVQKQPWIKGGAIVALDPKTGEVLALASYPRFDPNDFVPSEGSIFREGKIREVNRWLENERFIGAVWDGLETLKRERLRQCHEESLPLTWEATLDFLLSKESPIRAFFHRMDDVKGAIQLQEDYEAMLYYTRSGLTVPPDIRKRLEAIALSEEDKVFAVDLCRTIVYAPAFTDELIRKIGSMKLAQYRSLSQTFLRREAEEKQKAQEAFRHREFKAWREVHQKEFLAEKRKLEKEARTYAHPYIDHLDQKEKELFAAYWEEKRIPLLATKETPEDLIRTFRSFSQLNRPLLGKYKTLRNRKKIQTEKDLAASFYPIGGFGFGRSFAFEANAPQGSIFKLVTAFEGLRQGKQLTLIDELSAQGVAYTPNRTLYPRSYKGGRLPRSASKAIGKVDLVGALEQSSNPYFAILAGDCFADPEDLSRAARLFGFGEKTGIDLPGEKRGHVPTDLKTNRTGLYSTAMGQHTLLSTPLQTSVMLASIINGGSVFRPKLIKEIIGLTPDREPLRAFATHAYLAKEELDAIGIPFPLFTVSQPLTPLADTAAPNTEVKRTLPLDSRIRSTLMEGMDRVVWGAKGSARATTIKGLLKNPLLLRSYLDLEHQMIGKTGSAEIVYNLSINPSNAPQMYKHIWFSSAAFTDKKQEDPELIIVVFLRFGDAGKEAAPLAAQMTHKWREIKKKHKI